IILYYGYITICCEDDPHVVNVGHIAVAIRCPSGSDDVSAAVPVVQKIAFQTGPVVGYFKINLPGFRGTYSYNFTLITMIEVRITFVFFFGHPVIAVFLSVIVKD